MSTTESLGGFGLSPHQRAVGDRVIVEESAKREHLVVYLSGAHAYGFPSPDSDLDLFIDYDLQAKIPNIFRLMQIEETISRALGIPVTITTRDALHPLMKDKIEREAVRVI